MNKMHVLENTEPQFGRVMMAGADMLHDMHLLFPVPALGGRKDRLLH
jgi:hypothetical protein